MLSMEMYLKQKSCFYEKDFFCMLLIKKNFSEIDVLCRKKYTEKNLLLRLTQKGDFFR